MKCLTNSFSLNMIPNNLMSFVRVKPIASSEVPADVALCAIDDADTAKLLSRIFGVAVPVNRDKVFMRKNDTLYVAQYKGPRLPEGTTTLPEGASLDFFEVTFLPEGCKGCNAASCHTCHQMNWLRGG